MCGYCDLLLPVQSLCKACEDQRTRSYGNQEETEHFPRAGRCWTCTGIRASHFDRRSCTVRDRINRLGINSSRTIAKNSSQIIFQLRHALHDFPASFSGACLVFFHPRSVSFRISDPEKKRITQSRCGSHPGSCPSRNNPLGPSTIPPLELRSAGCRSRSRLARADHVRHRTRCGSGN
jgi:hypothetical protein